MDEDKLLNAVLAEIENAEVYSQSQMIEALNYYEGKPRPDDVEGSSNAQSLDVADMIEAITAQVMPMFEVDDLALFHALDESKEEQVRLESDLVNQIVLKDNDGFIQIQSTLKDALLFGLGILKAYVEETTSIEHVAPLEGLTQEDIFSIEQSLQPGQEITKATSNGVDVLSILTTTKSIKVVSVPPEEFSYTQGWQYASLKDCPFVAHSRLIKRYELVEMGYSPEVVQNLQGGFTSEQRQIRENYTYSPGDNADLDDIEYHEAYYIYDHDGDGYASRLKVCIAGRELLNVEEVDYHPFAAGLTVIYPHRLRGVSTFEQQKQVQDVKTKILRQYIDNMYVNNQRGLEAEIRNIIEPSDLTASAPGRVIRTRKIGSVAPIPVDDIGPSCQSLLSYMDQIRTNRSGASLDMASENMQVNNETAHGAERIISSKEMIATNLASTFAKTVIKDVFLLVHRILRDNFNEMIVAKVRGRWIETNPTTWDPQTKVTISIGMTKGEQIQQLNALSTILTQQAQAASQGLSQILVDYDQIYATLTDFARLSKLPNYHKYWQNPNSEKARAAIQNNIQAQQAQSEESKKLREIQLHYDVLKAQAEIDSLKAKETIENLKITLESYKSDIEKSKHGNELQQDLIKHYDSLAMQLTNLEAQYKEQIKDYQENRAEVTVHE